MWIRLPAGVLGHGCRPSVDRRRYCGGVVRRHFLAKIAKSAKETQDVIFLHLGDLGVLCEILCFWVRLPAGDPGCGCRPSVDRRRYCSGAVRRHFLAKDAKSTARAAPATQPFFLR